MITLIILIVFIGSFIGLCFFVFKKISVLVNLPEQIEESFKTKPMKQNILQKTSQIKQAVLNNRGVGAIGVVMAKAGGRFKTIFANRITTTEDLEKVEKIHQEGDYWQKVETHNLPTKKPRVRKKKMPK